MGNGFLFYKTVDWIIVVIVAVIGILGWYYLAKYRKERPLCFGRTCVGLVLSWLYLIYSNSSWPFWEKAYTLVDGGGGRIKFGEQAISIASERIFNNILIEITAIIIIGAFLWDLCIRYIKSHKTDSDNVESENQNGTYGIGLFYWSCIGLFLAQLFISYHWPATRLFSAQTIGYMKHLMRFIVSVAPIGLAFYFCNSFWKRLEDELNNKKFSDSIYPTLMVAQGTFYTFVGVSAILLTYTGGQNVDVILQGLKLAFLTSVVGLLYSIAARFKIKAAVDKHYTEVKNNEVKLATLKKINSTEEGIKVPEYLDERDFYVVLKNIDRSLAKFAGELVDANKDCLRKQADVFGEKLELVFNSLKKDMEEVSNHSADIKNNFEAQKVSSEELKNEMKALWENANGAYTNVSAVAENFNDLITNCKVEQLAPTVKQVSMLSESTERLNTNISAIIDKIGGNSDKIVAWSKNIETNLKNIMTADVNLYDEFSKYQQNIEKINLPKIADLLTVLTNNYEKLSMIKEQDVEFYETNKTAIEEQISLIKSMVHAQQAAVKEQEALLEELFRKQKEAINSKEEAVLASITAAEKDFNIRKEAIERLLVEREDGALQDIDKQKLAIEAKLKQHEETMDAIINEKEAFALKAIDEREAMMQDMLNQRKLIIEDTINNTRKLNASVGYASDALSTLQDRLNYDSDEVVSTIKEINNSIFNHHVEVSRVFYDKLITEQKKYLENLEAMRDKTMNASLDVTAQTLKHVINELKEHSQNDLKD